MVRGKMRESRRESGEVQGASGVGQDGGRADGQTDRQYTTSPDQDQTRPETGRTGVKGETWSAADAATFAATRRPLAAQDPIRNGTAGK